MWNWKPWRKLHNTYRPVLESGRDSILSPGSESVVVLHTNNKNVINVLSVIGVLFLKTRSRNFLYTRSGTTCIMSYVHCTWPSWSGSADSRDCSGRGSCRGNSEKNKKSESTLGRLFWNFFFPDQIGNFILHDAVRFRFSKKKKLVRIFF